ncbi:MAG: arginine--tRNA ligase [Thermoleophilia bacterium]|nr:arginine--tRNA ligase [Thermoleophilia bacterium]
MADTTEFTALRGLRSALQSIVDDLARAGNAAGTPKVELERPRDESHGDYATNAALLLAPLLQTNPRAVAEQIAEAAGTLPGVTSITVAGPGFINVTMQDAWFLETVQSALEAGDTFGSNVIAHPEPILLEFVSANPLGPLVAASARHAAYGDSLARVLRHAGHEVATEYYVNDAGRQVELFGRSILARVTGADIPQDGYEGAYVVDLAAELGATATDDPDELGRRGVAKMVEAIHGSLDKLGAHFDRFQSERELHDAGKVLAGVETVRAAGPIYEDDGATLLRTTTWGDDRDRAVIRGNGIPTYFAADIAYMVDKFARVGDGARLIYVLGADHHGFIGRLKAVSQALGFDPEHVEIVIMQMVNFVEGGEQKQMSKRKGTFVSSDELVDRIGVDATRFLMLQRSHDQSLDLDLDLAEQQNDTNPVFYVQYAHARLASIRRKVEAEGGAPEIDLAALATDISEPLHPSEKRLVKRLGDFPIVIAEAAERRQPHRLFHYAQDLASDVAKFYRDCRVAGDEIPADVTARRLATCDAARSVLKLNLQLVGVSAPDRM